MKNAVTQTFNLGEDLDGGHKPKSQHKLDEINWEAVGLGQKPDTEIAHELGLSREQVRGQRRKRGILAYDRLYLSQEGRPLASVLEAKYDCCLHATNIPHEHQIRYPGLALISDFKVADTFIEIVGALAYPCYAAAYEKKRGILNALPLKVSWVFPNEVESLFQGCPIQLRVRDHRRCARCGVVTVDLVKKVCRTCYMLIWHDDQEVSRTCQYCGKPFLGDGPQKFCNHSCYAKSLEMKLPPMETIIRELETTSCSELGRKYGVLPGTIHMRVHRYRKRLAAKIVG